MSDVEIVPKADPADPEKGPKVAGHGAEWWTKEVKKSFDAWRDYRNKARKVVDRYRDERKQEVQDRKRFNILFSNVETLGPAVYSQAPTPDIRRRFQDKDDVGRVAATVLQRSTQYAVESYDFDGVLDRCKMDYLLPGFAVARVVYRPYFKKPDAPKPEAETPVEDAAEGGEAAEQQPQAPAQPQLPELIYQEVGCDYVPWDRFAMARSRVYERAWWQAVADDLTKDEIRAQFGKVADELSYSGHLDDKETDDEKNRQETVRIWEVWCKRGRVRFFLAEGFAGWLKPPEADPLRLENFFPWPKPLWAIQTNESLMPIPEYLEYQDQALELDDLTERIDVLTSALRRRGFYAADQKDVLGEVMNATDNTFKPIDNWAQFMDKGGLQGLVATLPLDELLKAVTALEERREIVKQTIYEVTGISDIIRGATKSDETATAQQIKSRWGGMRISTRQKKFANFARDIVRLKAEIIAERFDPQTLSLMSGIRLPTMQEKQMFQQQQAAQQQQMQQYQQMAQQAQQRGGQPPPPPQMQQPSKDQQDYFAQPTWEEVIQVLRNDKLRGFKIDIETDSTVTPDAQAEQQGRTQLLAAIGTFSQNVAPAVQEGLMSPELASSLIKFAVRAFKVGSEVEQELEALGQNAVSPQMQQAQKQLQDQQQQVAQQQQQAKDAGHQADIKRKDSELAAQRAEHAKEVFDLVTRHKAELRAKEQEHAQNLHTFAKHAENAVVDTINSMAPQSATPQ